MDADTIRSEVRGWLEGNWDAELPLVKWRTMLADSGWGLPAWPVEWFGRGLPRELAALVTGEFNRVGAVGAATGAATALAGPTILTHGSDEIKRRFLRRAVTGEDHWCQLFSEPGAGSDLAGLQTKAELHGDEWVVNGQKVWTTGARTADLGLLLARTNWDVPKHQGITYLILPMKQPGVEVRPLKQANGFASFNEIFITDARVPADNVIGQVNGGWTVAMTTLAHERQGIGQLGRVPSITGNGRAQREAMDEATEIARTYSWYRSRAGRPDQVPMVAKMFGRTGDAVMRQRMAHLYSLEKIAQWNVMRSRAAIERGLPAGPEGSLSKLSGTRIGRVAAGIHGALAGAAGMLAGEDGPMKGVIAEVLISYPAASIAGGTDEIQRNIVGERVLGLPREPSVDHEIPFREVKQNVPRGRG
jgi:alkylation response protein AidB-like acyl-CoA dehydrogenase